MHISPIKSSLNIGFTSKRTEKTEIKNTPNVEAPEAFDDFDISYAAEIGQNIIKGEINDADFELMDKTPAFKHRTLSGTINNKNVSLTYSSSAPFQANTLKGTIGDENINLSIKNRMNSTAINGQFGNDYISLNLENYGTHYLLKGNDCNGKNADLKIRLKGRYSTDTEAIGKFELNPDIMPIVMNHICKSDFNNRMTNEQYILPLLHPYSYPYYPMYSYSSMSYGQTNPGYYM